MRSETLPSERSARLFLALDLPVEWKEHLEKAIGLLGQSNVLPVRWVRPAGIHLTLKFLGNVAISRRPEITSQAGSLEQLPWPLNLRVGELGTFGGPNRTRVVWMNVAGDLQQLARLAGQIDSSLSAIGFPAESRPFRPHLTLGRVVDTATVEDRRRIHQVVTSTVLNSHPAGSFDRVHLFRSHLGAGGAVYEPLAEITGA